MPKSSTVFTVGEKVIINGEEKTIATLTKNGLLTTTDGSKYDLWFDILEKA